MELALIILTLREFLTKYEAGDFDAKDDTFNCMVAAGWRDWFCEDEELPEKTVRLYDILKEVKNPYLLDHYAVCFNNHEPVDLPRYDAVEFVPVIRELNGAVSYDPDDTGWFEVDFDDPYEQCRYFVQTTNLGEAIGARLFGAGNDCQKTDSAETLIDWLNSAPWEEILQESHQPQPTKRSFGQWLKDIFRRDS